MSKEILISENKSPRIDLIRYESDFCQVKITPVNNSNPDAEFEFFVSNKDMEKEDAEKNAKFVGLAKSAVLTNLSGGCSSFCFVREVNELGSGNFAKIGPLPVKKPAPQPDSECHSDIHTHEEAKGIMDARKAEIRGEASPLVGGIVGEVSSFISAYERPAIVITDRIGDAESTIEFATSADYKAWKELE